MRTTYLSGTLPDVETSPLLYLRFTPKAPIELILDVAARLDNCGIIIVTAEGLDDGDKPKLCKASVVLGLTTTQKLLENEAEIIKLVKPCRTMDSNILQIMEHFSVDARDNFIHVDGSIDKDNERFYDSLGLFTAAERVLLLQSMINSVPVLDANNTTTNSAAQDSDRCLKRTFHSILEKYSNAGEDNSKLLLVTSLRTLGYVDVVCPVHIPHLREYILRDTLNLMTSPPVHAIRNYYGEGVAFYFAWMDFVSKWIRIPGIIGLIVYCVRKRRGYTIDNCDLTPFFGIVIFVWATIFNRFWERREASLAYQWGSYAITDRDTLHYGKRANFKGEMRQSPVTGRIEKFYSPTKRKLKCAVSILLSTLLLVCPCMIMCISMNTQGYISSDDAKEWGSEDHPLHFKFFAELAEPGGIFDASSSWKCFLPIILRSIMVNFMNQMYRKAAEVLTEWENHELAQHHENSLVLKRFAFEAFDAYIVLFYLAIYERNIHLLRLELVGAMSADTFRRMLTESVIPYALQKLSAQNDNRSMNTKKDDDTDKGTEQQCSAEVGMDEYEVFDDYIEMLIQFGYITLFASAFPLASFVAIFANIIEYRSDCWKLSRVFRRPDVIKTASIGMWKHLLNMMVSLSALTNCLIFAFTSSQLQQFIPNRYVIDHFGRPALKTGTAEETMLLMLGLEHSLILLAALVKSIVPKVPQHVKNGINKREYLHQALLSKGRLRMMEAEAAITVQNYLAKPKLEKNVTM